MKSKAALFLPVTIISLLGLFVSERIGSGQNEAKPATTVVIPDDLKAVFQHSCAPCHWQGGGLKATLHVNFSKWDGYSSGAQVQKAKKICSVLADEKMPPEQARKEKPELIPTELQVDAICKWAQNLNVDTIPALNKGK